MSEEAAPARPPFINATALSRETYLIKLAGLVQALVEALFYDECIDLTDLQTVARFCREEGGRAMGRQLGGAYFDIASAINEAISKQLEEARDRL